MTATVPAKQRSEQRQWEALLTEIAADPGAARARATPKVQAAADYLRQLIPPGARAAYAWSGGKDSQVVRRVCETAGITEAVLVLTRLEFTAFEDYVTAEAVPDLTILRREWDLPWLAAHQDMIFPQDSRDVSRWFAPVQWWGERTYCQRNHVDYLILGRRRSEGNRVGPGGIYRHGSGHYVVSPLADWSHADVLDTMIGFGLTFAPCYSWPRGFRVGTGPWAKRRVDHPDQGWAEVHEIEPGIVHDAATAGIGAAADWLARNT